MRLHTDNHRTTRQHKGSPEAAAGKGSQQRTHKNTKEPQAAQQGRVQQEISRRRLRCNPRRCSGTQHAAVGMRQLSIPNLRPTTYSPLEEAVTEPVAELVEVAETVLDGDTLDVGV